MGTNRSVSALARDETKIDNNNIKIRIITKSYNARDSGKLVAPASNFSDCLRLLNFSKGLARLLGQSSTYDQDFVYT